MPINWCRDITLELLLGVPAFRVFDSYLDIEHNKVMDENAEHLIFSVRLAHNLSATTIVSSLIQLDWPCVSGVRVINSPPSRGPNSLFLVVSTFPEHFRSFDGVAL